MNNEARVQYLKEISRKLIVGCRVPANDGTILYTPDGKGDYKALWTRDFAYMVENAGDLMPTDEVQACIRYLLKGQRSDGAIPDRVRPDGVPIYAAGPDTQPVGEPNLDNAQFLVIAVDEYLRRCDRDHARTLFNEWAAQLDRGMDYIPRSDHGLVYNNPAKPHSPYGFTDTVAKTGQLFMESLLNWTACKRMASWYTRTRNADKRREYEKRMRLIERNIDILWDAQAGAFLAATQDCRQLDIWGNAYAIYVGFPLRSKRERVLNFLLTNHDRYVWRGQVRHLLQGEYWQRLLIPIEKERYQNGAYWATASGWVMWAIAQKNPDLARQMFADLIQDFREGGICECVNEGYRKLDSYVVSATNPLAAARRLGFNKP